MKGIEKQNPVSWLNINSPSLDQEKYKRCKTFQRSNLDFKKLALISQRRPLTSTYQMLTDLET
jgi:hypothetical protein